MTIYIINHNLICLICTTCRNPERKGSLLDDVWDEEEGEADEEVGKGRKPGEEREMVVPL